MQENLVGQNRRYSRPSVHLWVRPPDHVSGYEMSLLRSQSIQLFRERLSEKVHATISKGIVGGFEFSVLLRNLKKLARKAMEMCLRVLTESNKSRFDSYNRREQCTDHIPLPFAIVTYTFFPTTFLEIAVYNLC